MLVDLYVRNVQDNPSRHKRHATTHETVEPLVAAAGHMLARGGGGGLLQLLQHAADCEECAAGACIGDHGAIVEARVRCARTAAAVRSAVAGACKGIASLPMFRTVVAAALRASGHRGALTPTGPVATAGSVPVFLTCYRHAGTTQRPRAAGPAMRQHQTYHFHCQYLQRTHSHTSIGAQLLRQATT